MIALLSSDHYLAPLRRWREGAHFTHLARVDFAGETATAFVKIYPPGTGGVFGEALGYLASAHLKTPRPEHATVMAVPVAMLRGLDAPAWLSECGDHVWAWCCQRIQGRTLEQYYKPAHEHDAVYAALLKTMDGSSVAAIDETFSNGDRNAGSLIRLNSRSWAVIDHGECLGSHCWPSTGPYDTGATFLMRNANRLLDDDFKRELQSRAIEAAHQIGEAMPKWRPLLLELLQVLNLTSAGSGVMPFLDARTQRQWMPNRLGWLT
ncbi:MAG TPA: hypothetical protein VFS13_00745 [Steroidobacteraceae bacterium]|nr:hypothetical protein [Steroidobacteraceae bacterium]